MHSAAYGPFAWMVQSASVRGYLLVGALALLAACGGTAAVQPAPSLPAAPAASSAKSLLTFGFAKSVHGTAVDADVTITGTTVHAFLPPGTVRSALRPFFTVSPGATVLLNNQPVSSGDTAMDCTQPVTLVVRAADGSTATYTVSVTTDIASIDGVMQAFMAKHAVPALSLAITRDEQLVYAKAYGWADASQPLTPAHLFRIASLSKPVTAIAILRLVEQGRLTLGQRVFGDGGILGRTYGSLPYGPGITDITVDQLLQHTAGGWPNDAADPMFSNPGMSISQLLSWTLDHRPLSNSPGSRYAYSNFGYAVLGRVIERITGEPYATAVRTLVLTPSGISSMRIGGRSLAERVAGEVHYVGQGGENPYAVDPARMDAHGGWIASATDLARLLVRVDGQPRTADLLTASTLATMSTGSTANAGYGRGWSVNGPNWWHTGSLPGTGTEMARTTSRGNFNFVILTNTRNASGTYFSDLDGLFWSALAATGRWPSYDLFVP